MEKHCFAESNFRVHKYSQFANRPSRMESTVIAPLLNPVSRGQSRTEVIPRHRLLTIADLHYQKCQALIQPSYQYHSRG